MTIRVSPMNHLAPNEVSDLVNVAVTSSGSTVLKGRCDQGKLYAVEGNTDHVHIDSRLTSVE